VATLTFNVGSVPKKSLINLAENCRLSVGVTSDITVVSVAMSFIVLLLLKPTWLHYNFWNVLKQLSLFVFLFGISRCNTINVVVLMLPLLCIYCLHYIYKTVILC